MFSIKRIREVFRGSYCFEGNKGGVCGWCFMEGISGAHLLLRALTLHSLLIFIERLNSRSTPYSLPRKIEEQGCFFSAAPGVIIPQSSLQYLEFQGLI